MPPVQWPRLLFAARPVSAWRLASRLEIGDRVMVEEPPGVGKITKLARSTTMIDAHTKKFPRPNPALAVIADFEVLTGRGAGTHTYFYLHPDDKVILA